MASGVSASEPRARPANNASQLSGLPPMTASATAVVPKISTGTLSGIMRSESSSPPRRILTVSALPTAPISVRHIVPNSKLATSEGRPCSGRPSMIANSGDTNASRNPVVNQCAATSASTSTASGYGASASCSKLPSSKSEANNLALTMRLASSATTHRMPGAIAARRSGSGPRPKGKRVTTMKKNNSGFATSAGLAMSDRIWRTNCRVKAACSESNGRSGDMLCQIQVMLQRAEAAGLMAGKNGRPTRLHMLTNTCFEPITSRCV